jgi:glycosyltransferase involved in cell wall biosynthesis
MNFLPIPSISVILPTYNRTAKLSRAIESVIRQSYQDWELIVIDDGSTDHTCDILHSYLRRDSRIRYMAHSNRNAALSRNAGIQAAMGEYITFLDSDDYYLDHHLESRYRYVCTNEHIDLVSGGFCGDDDVFVKDCTDTDRMIHISQCILCGTLFGRRNVFVELGGFGNLTYAEDHDFWQRASGTYRVRKITSPRTYVYRRSEDSITVNYRQSTTDDSPPKNNE